MQYRRGALLFLEIIHQISRLHGSKIDDLYPILSKITWPVAAIKSLRFALFILREMCLFRFECNFFLNVICNVSPLYTPKQYNKDRASNEISPNEMAKNLTITDYVTFFFKCVWCILTISEPCSKFLHSYQIRKGAEWYGMYVVLP